VIGKSFYVHKSSSIVIDWDSDVIIEIIADTIVTVVEFTEEDDIHSPYYHILAAGMIGVTTQESFKRRIACNHWVELSN
jgi:hypothetical protein